MDELNKFYQNNKKLCLALNSWLMRNNKSFNLSTALAVIYTFCNGNKNMMVDVIKQFRESMKTKVQGRSQVYADGVNGIDIIHDPNGSGQLTVVGYAPEREAPLKGQHRVEDPTKTKSGATSKNVERSLEKFEDVGQIVRELYPGVSKYQIQVILTTINDYAKRKKKSQMAIAQGLKDGNLRLTQDMRQIKAKIRESKTIFINEDVADMIGNEMKMTEYKFNSNVKRFLHDLLVNPVKADTSSLLQLHGLDRNKMLKLLHDFKMIEKSEKISDKNEDGTPKTAVMIVKYNVPKKDFDHNLKKLFISQFEKNVGCLNEDGEGGGAMGGDQAGATTTSTVGDYQYTVPLFSDIISPAGYRGDSKKKKKKDPAFNRGDGIGGSTSMHRIKNK